MPPRYQCYSLGEGWSWRLLGSNNRVLARSPHARPDAAGAARAARTVADLAAHGQIELISEAGTAWRWALLKDGQVLAVASNPYARRLECLRAVARFRACAPDAILVPQPLTFPGVGQRRADR